MTGHAGSRFMLVPGLPRYNARFHVKDPKKFIPALMARVEKRLRRGWFYILGDPVLIVELKNRITATSTRMADHVNGDMDVGVDDEEGWEWIITREWITLAVVRKDAGVKSFFMDAIGMGDAFEDVYALLLYFNKEGTTCGQFFDEPGYKWKAGAITARLFKVILEKTM